MESYGRVYWGENPQGYVLDIPVNGNPVPSKYRIKNASPEKPENQLEKKVVKKKIN